MNNPNTMGADGLVERLNACHEYAMAHLAADLQPAEDDPPPHSIYAEAADRIEALEGEIAEFQNRHFTSLALSAITIARSRAEASEALVTGLRNQLKGAKEALMAVHEPYKTLTEEALAAGILMEHGPPKPDRGAAQILVRKALAASTLYRLEGDQENGASVAGLPAHVADATATDTPHSTGKEGQ